MAKAVDMEVDDYTDQTLKALTGSRCENFVYQIREKDKTLEVNELF